MMFYCCAMCIDCRLSFLCRHSTHRQKSRGLRHQKRKKRYLIIYSCGTVGLNAWYM